MIVGLQTMKKLMKKATNRQITAKAVFLMAERMEELVIDITKKAEALLVERNKDRDSPNIPHKEKITDELINEILLRGG